MRMGTETVLEMGTVLERMVGWGETILADDCLDASIPIPAPDTSTSTPRGMGRMFSLSPSIPIVRRRALRNLPPHLVEVGP